MRQSNTKPYRDSYIYCDSNSDRYRVSDANGNFDTQTYPYGAPTADTEASPDTGAASIAHNADCND